jgi:hypothetical protein
MPNNPKLVQYGTPESVGGNKSNVAAPAPDYPNSQTDPQRPPALRNRDRLLIVGGIVLVCLLIAGFVFFVMTVSQKYSNDQDKNDFVESLYQKSSIINLCTYEPSKNAYNKLISDACMKDVHKSSCETKELSVASLRTIDEQSEKLIDDCVANK